MHNLQTIVDVSFDAGFTYRGAFRPDSADAVPDCGFPEGAGTVVLLGNVGSDMWPAFSKGRRDEQDAMNNWTLRTLEALLPGLREQYGGAVMLYPFGPPPYHPFQRWAMRAEQVFSSPIGPLIHPEFGLWHAYRGALVLEKKLEIPALSKAANPCDSCREKPCLSTCPVSAFAKGTYDVETCANYLVTPEGETCLSGHCQARRACPVGQEYAYVEDQSRFHMGVFRDLYATKP